MKTAEDRRAYARAYSQRPEVRAKKKAYTSSEEFKANRREQYSQGIYVKEQKSYTLKRLYGITLIEYNELLEWQDNKCAICKKDASEFSKPLAVDHCHINKHIRGLLCGKCNAGIGFLQDSPEIAISAAEYLKNTNVNNTAKHYK